VFFIFKELIGFARLCPGDTYELQVKYGRNSKFRTRAKISKNGSQLWDKSKFAFKTTVYDLLLIRVKVILNLKSIVLLSFNFY